MRLHSRLLVLMVLAGSGVGAQGPSSPTFPTRSIATTTTAAESLTVKDLLDIKTVSVADLSSDGRWLAITVGVRRDGLGNDFSRDGDPTYLRASPAELLIVDTRNLAQRPVFRGKTMVRGVTWSPDARFLVSSMQENALHGWRLVPDKAHMRMSGYPSKTRSFSWSHDGQFLATSGAEAAIIWPFDTK